MRLTTSSPSCAECNEIWEPKPPGTLWATPDLLRDCFTFFTFLRFCQENVLATRTYTDAADSNTAHWRRVSHFVATNAVRKKAILLCAAD